MTTRPFDKADLEKILSLPQDFKMLIWVLILACIPASFLFGLFGLGRTGIGYWKTTVLVFIIFLIGVLYKLSKGLYGYYKDKKHRKKLVARVTVLDKSNSTLDKIIHTDNKYLRKIEVPTEEEFEAITIGDIVVVEVSKYSKKLLKIAQHDLSRSVT